MTTTKNVQYNLYDISGKSIMQQNTTAGDHRIDVSSLNSGVYILYFRNEEGQEASSRVIKK